MDLSHTVQLVTQLVVQMPLIVVTLDMNSLILETCIVIVEKTVCGMALLKTAHVSFSILIVHDPKNQELCYISLTRCLAGFFISPVSKYST